ncbi:MAG: ATP-binding cassette domain-containing protein, partial [Acidimicrobiales bacterium]
MYVAIEVEQLAKVYAGGTEALRDVTFHVDEGEIFGYLGRNGGGKTTTVRILTGLTRPTGGRARVAGLDVVERSDVIRARIGVTLQEAALDELLTGREFLTLVASLWGMPRKAARARADELLELEVEHLDLANREAQIIGKGGSAERIFWDSEAARLLARHLASRSRGPVFLADKASAPTRQPAAGDRDPDT